MRSPVPTDLNNKKLHSAVLATAWLLMHGILLWQYGVVTSYEATKYVSEADHLLKTGSYSSNNFLFYSTQILLIAASKSLHTGYGGVVAVQLLLNAVSTYCFYKTIERLTGRAAVAFFFTMALVWMFYYQLYNVYLFTESLYFSFSIIFFHRLIQVKKLAPSKWAELILLLALLYFTRPVGIFFVPATFVFLVLRFYRKKALKIFLVAGVLLLAGFVLLLNYGMSSGGEFNFILPYTEKQVICSLPSGKKSVQIPVKQNSVQGLFYLVVHYPKLFITLFCKRTYTFFSLIRPYYSFAHNVFAAWVFYTLYLFAFDGIKKHFRARMPEIAFAASLIFFTALTVGLTCDESYNRFLYAILPFLMVLASLAFFEKTKSKQPALEA